MYRKIKKIESACTLYSVLNASTGFLFAAALAGIKPEINVKMTLIEIINIAWEGFNEAIV